MSKLKRLVKNYGEFVDLPWRDDAAAAQRVIFAVYGEQEELALRAKIDEFELVSRDAGHDWIRFDLTDSFPQWMATQRYAKRYFERPELLNTLLPRYLDWLAKEFEQQIEAKKAGSNSVIALQGVGSLFGFLKVKSVVDRLSPMVPGRLLVLFPGSYEGDNYRLLDGYDGWNYLATPITAEKVF